MRASPPLRSIRFLVPLASLGAIACGDAPGRWFGEEASGLSVCHTTVVEGIDVAEFDGAVDWNAVHASGREFAITRIADGGHHDPTFAANWAGIRAAGMIRGAYLFFRPTHTVASQADTVAAAVGRLSPGDLPVTIDVECMCSYNAAGTCDSAGTGCASATTAASVLTGLSDRIRADTGKTPMIYTSKRIWNGATYLDGAASLPQDPLWVAGWLNGCVTMPSSWTDWTIWQYSDGTCSGCIDANTTVPGVPSSPGVDRDRFNGSLADLTAFANRSPIPEWGAVLVGQSYPSTAAGALQIRPGESATVWLELKNVGTRTWDACLALATTEPRDHADPFAGTEWPSPSRVANLATGSSVMPGLSHRFEWILHAPAALAPGRYDQHLGLVENGVWFGDPDQGGPPDDGLSFAVEVLEPMAAADGGVRDAGRADSGAGTDAAMESNDAASKVTDSASPAANASGGGKIDGGCRCAGAVRPPAGFAALGLQVFSLLLVLGRRRVAPRLVNPSTGC